MGCIDSSNMEVSRERERVVENRERVWSCLFVIPIHREVEEEV
jgi:hypothetical protein